MQQMTRTGSAVGMRTASPMVLLLAVFASQLISCGQDHAGSDPAADDAKEWLDTEYRNKQKIHAADPGVRVARGLLANRKHRYIDILATATGVGSDVALDAFIVTDSNKSRGAIAVTTVEPAAIQSALEFIGMSAGHPLDGASMHHWPKGERVSITFYWGERESGLFNESVRAEDLITDTRWNTQLPALGFRFVGSAGHGADEIVTVFNATNTVLEVPYIVDRMALQGMLVASEEYRFSPGQKLRIRIRPEFRDDRRRVRDFTLDIQAGVGADAEQLQNLGVRLSTPAGALLVDGNFESTFVYLKALIDDGKEPFLQVRFSDSLAAGSVQMVARFVQSFLIAQDVRIEPDETHVFYSAFLPRDAWRDPNRRGRASQPVEVHLQGAGEFRGEIVQYPQTADKTVALKRISFRDIKEFGEAMQQGEPWQTEGVFLFVSPATPYRDIRRVYELVHTLFPNLYVFM